MKKIGKLRHELRTENMISSESSTYQIIEVVNALVDAHNELIETHTVKEPKRTIWVEEAAYNRGYVTGRTDCEKSHTVASPSNSEKKEHKHRMEDTPFNSEYCLDCGVVFGKKEEVKEEPTTPENNVKISCPDCPHEETATPEKKPFMDEHTYEEMLLSLGYVKTPKEWIASGFATPAQMIYHIEWIKNRKKKLTPEKEGNEPKVDVHVSWKEEGEGYVWKNLPKDKVIEALEELHSKENL